MRRLCRVPSRDVGDMGGAFSEVSEVGIEPDSRAMRPTKRKRFRQVKSDSASGADAARRILTSAETSARIIWRKLKHNGLPPDLCPFDFRCDEARSSRFTTWPRRRAQPTQPSRLCASAFRTRPTTRSARPSPRRARRRPSRSQRRLKMAASPRRRRKPRRSKATQRRPLETLPARRTPHRQPASQHPI